MSLNWKMGPIVYRSCGETLAENFVGTVLPLPNGGWRIWYSKFSSTGMKYSFGYFELDGTLNLAGDTLMRIAEKESSEGLNVIGVPEHWNLIQPVYIRLPDGRHRIYFWAHGSEGICRFLAADSTDGINYRVYDWHSPCLYHPNDRAISRADLKHSQLTIYCHEAHRDQDPYEPEASTDMLANDATNVYLLKDGSFELYSAEVIELPKDSPEPRQKDPIIRRIQRRTSKDGLHWSAPDTVLQRDSKDPFDLQHYYLAANHIDGCEMAWLGYYSSDPGLMDLELAASEDGIHWRRTRGPAFPRGRGTACIYAPNAMVERDGMYHLFYSAFNMTHHGTLDKDSEYDMPASWIALATVPCHELTGFCRDLMKKTQD